MPTNPETATYQNDLLGLVLFSGGYFAASHDS
jgi:hypothetical protein